MTGYVLGNMKWGSSLVGTPAGQVTWSFATASYDGYQFDRFFAEPAYMELIRDAFDAWERVADIDFVEVADGPAVEIRLGWDSFDGPYGTVGEASLFGISDAAFDPEDPRYSLAMVEIAFDPAENFAAHKGVPASTEISFYSVALHEIGHAIGLEHTDDAGTVMYPIAGDVVALTAGDISGAEALYGPAPLPAAPLADLISANPAQAKALAAIYELFLGGVPTAAGFMSLITANNETNFGAETPFDPGPAFNDENIFINITNALYQGNPNARQAFEALAAGDSLPERLTSIYEALIPVGERSSAGLETFLSQQGFYVARAAELGISGADGGAVVGFAALINIAVREEIGGIGDAVNDLIEAVLDDSATLPSAGSSFTPIEVADGTAHDADDVGGVEVALLAPLDARDVSVILADLDALDARQADWQDAHIPASSGPQLDWSLVSILGIHPDESDQMLFNVA